MEKLLETLTFGHVLRNFLAGVAFFVSAVVARPSLQSEVLALTKDYPLSFAFVVLLVGVLTYVACRATLIPVIEIIRELTVGFQPIKRPAEGVTLSIWAKLLNLLSSRDFTNHALTKWKLDVPPKGELKNTFGQKLREWSDYVIFAYVTVLAILFGLLVGGTRWMTESMNIEHWTGPTILAVLLLLIGIAADIRKQIIENEVMRRVTAQAQ